MTDPLTEAVARAIKQCVHNYPSHVRDPVSNMSFALAQAAIAAMREQLVPVGWQRRAQWPLASDPPGKINQWEQCSHDEATSHFDRRAGCEYRAIYAFPSAPTEGEG